MLASIGRVADSRVTRLINSPSRPVVAFRTPILLRNRLYRRNVSLRSYGLETKNMCQSYLCVRFGRVTGFGLCDRCRNECSTPSIGPGMDVRLENTHDKRVCYRTSTSAQLPRATAPCTSHQADSRMARLFEGEQLIIGIIARTPNFVENMTHGG